MLTNLRKESKELNRPQEGYVPQLGGHYPKDTWGGGGSTAEFLWLTEEPGEPPWQNMGRKSHLPYSLKCMYLQYNPKVV